MPQSAILYATMMGMDVTLAHPEGMDLDPKIVAQCEQYADTNGGSFKISHDFRESMCGAHVGYPKAWCSTDIFQPPVGQSDAVRTQEIFDQHKDWMCDCSVMDLADKNAIYLHCLPCDRGYEVPNDVIY